MHILFVEPYYGGSHKAFLDGWREASDHTFTVLTLPARHWKWRMRHAAASVSEKLAASSIGGDIDLIVCSDMLDAAQWRGFSRSLAHVPLVVYFHENQLVYPDAYAGARDVHFGMTNILSALAADAVWFNSDYHRESFAHAARELLAGMPDMRPDNWVDRIMERSSICYPGVALESRQSLRGDVPRICYVSRWEQDKRPDLFFDAVAALESSGAAYRLSVVGGHPTRRLGEQMNEARTRFAHRIDHWGYVDSAAEFRDVLRSADLVVSTAEHEFFGLGLVEAVSAGAFPLAPAALAYPEVLSPLVDAGEDVLCRPEQLPQRLCEAVAQASAGTLWRGDVAAGRLAMIRYGWPSCARVLDTAASRCLL